MAEVPTIRIKICHLYVSCYCVYKCNWIEVRMTKNKDEPKINRQLVSFRVRTTLDKGKV